MRNLFISFDLTSTPTLIIRLLDGGLASVSLGAKQKIWVQQEREKLWSWDGVQAMSRVSLMTTLKVFRWHTGQLWGFVLGLGAWERIDASYEHFQSFHTRSLTSPPEEKQNKVNKREMLNFCLADCSNYLINIHCGMTSKTTGILCQAFTSETK